MIHADENYLLVNGQDTSWEARFATRGAAGPELLNLDGMPVIRDFHCEINNIADKLALGYHNKIHRKGKTAIVKTKGKLPFGSGVSFTHNHRFDEGIWRVTSDMQVPSGTVIKGGVVFSAFDILFQPEEINVMDDGKWSGWQALEENQRWDKQPECILLRKDDFTFEIGLGNDLWRWRKGLLPEHKPGSFQLVQGPDDCWIFKRWLCELDVEEELDLPHRKYRFSCYFAWSLKDKKGKAPEKAAEAVFTDDKELDIEHAKDQEGLIIDLHKLAMPKSAMTDDGKAPCLASKPCMNRLKRLVRQLAANPEIGPLVFKNLQAKNCLQGSHLQRKGKLAHWDLSSICDFAAWTRQILGDDRQIHWDQQHIQPSIQNIFRCTDHDVPSVSYEYNPRG